MYVHIFTGGRSIVCSKLFSSNNIRKILAVPKNREYLTNFQKHKQWKKKQKLAQKSDNEEFANLWYLQFLGSGANGAPRSLFLFTDKKRYLFNVGESTQKMANEYKVRISGTENIFVTYPIWENIGGLPGLILTLQDSGVQEVTIHGSKKLLSFFEAASDFVILNKLNIRYVICEKNRKYKDSFVTIESVPLVSNNPKTLLDSRSSVTSITNDIQAIVDDLEFYVKLENGEKAGSKIAPSVLATAKNYMNLPAADSPVALAYICSTPPKLGGLNLSKCVDKGVPPGPLLAKLKNGQDVRLPDGTFVKAADVKYPDEKAISFIVVDCPTVNFIESLCHEQSFRKFQTGEVNENILSYVIHFTPSEVMDDDRYRAWMQKFPKKTIHLNANDKNKCLGSVGCHEMQYKLSLLDSTIFPLLADDTIPISNHQFCSDNPDDILEAAKKDKLESEKDHLTRNEFNFPDDYVNTLRMLPLRPVPFTPVKCFPDCVYVSPEFFVGEVMMKLGFAEELQSLKMKLESLNSVVESNRKQQPYPRITILGTGSSSPNKYRNVSGILVTFSDESHILMDCGEGTYGQIVRHFGAKRAAEILANLNIIFVSHIHADHHVGLISILKHRRKAATLHNAKYKKVFLLAPKMVLGWLIKYQQQLEEVFDSLEYISNQDLEYRFGVDAEYKKLLSVAPLQNIVTACVVHCPQAFGISFTDANGCRVTYSGDTMPSTHLINIGKQSDLLIHEATFEDDLIGEANAKYHSTTSQAIEVGEKMEAKFTLLTHFSQRYAKVPFITDAFPKNVGVAFDHMEICMCDLPKLHLFNPALRLMFEEQIKQIEVRNFRRKGLLNE